MSIIWSSQLCPWLMPAFERMCTARRQGTFGHAWLLTGPHGIGKSNLAHVLAAQLVTARAPDPEPLGANRAAAARATARDAAGGHPDIHVLTPAIDKKKVSVEQVRDVIADLELTSLGGIGKALVIEPAEAMTLAAANALLKTLEEPTADTYFLLVADQPGFLPATIRSRCQLFSVPPPTFETALQWLEEEIDAEQHDGLDGVLRICGGRPLQALELIQRGKINLNKELSDIFEHIYDDIESAQSSAARWLKNDAEMLLSWLSTRLEWTIKTRLAPDAWTPVTDLGDDNLHNAWRDLTPTELFERWGEATALRRRIGSGTNLELELRVLIQGMTPGVASCE